MRQIHLSSFPFSSSFALGLILALAIPASLMAQAKPGGSAKPAAAPAKKPAAAKPGAPAAAGGFDTAELKKLVQDILKARKLKADGRTIRARLLESEVSKQLTEMFPAGKKFKIGADCPLMVRGKPGAQRIGLACFPAAREGKFYFDFYRSTGIFTNKEHLSEDKVVGQIESFPVFQEFTGSLQVVQDLTGKRTFDLDRLVVYVRFVDVKAEGGSAAKPAKPAAPASKPGAAAKPPAAAGGEAAKPEELEPASLEDFSVLRCAPMLALPADPPEKPRSGPRAVPGPGEFQLQRCESVEAVCILRKGGGISCWPKPK